MHQNWKSNEFWPLQIHDFQKAVFLWNKNTFGNIFKTKQRLIERMDRIQYQLANVFNHVLWDKQQTLWKEYEDILAQEELL